MLDELSRSPKSTASRSFMRMPFAWVDGRLALPARARRGWPKSPEGWTVTVLGQANLSCWRCTPTRNWRSASPKRRSPRPPPGWRRSQRWGERRFEAELHRLRGGALLAGAGTVSEAEAAIEQSIDVARAQNAKSWELRGAMSLARLRRQQGRQQEAVARSPQSSVGSPKASRPPISERPRRCSTN